MFQILILIQTRVHFQQFFKCSEPALFGNYYKHFVHLKYYNCTLMRNIFSFYPLCGMLFILLLFSCAPKISVVSCTSQEYYPGRQEEKPYQEIVVEVSPTEESVQIDSLQYGNQTLLMRGKKTTYTAKAEGTKFYTNATLYYSKKNKQYSVEIDSISKLDPLYLP